MLYRNKTREHDSNAFDVADSQTVIEEGLGMVIDTSEGGVAKVKPGTGDDAEVFAGVSINDYVRPSVGTKVEELTISPAAAYVVELAKTPLSPTTLVGAKLADGTILTYGDPGANATEFSISGTTVTFNSAQAGKIVTLTYQYTLTVIEARALTGDTNPGTANAAIANVSIIRKGEIYTSKYNTANDWSEANISDVKVGANGILQRGGTGASLPPSTYILHVPTTDEPFLGIYFSA